MATFPDTVTDGQRSGNSQFTQTCNLLSQFLKEKRSFGAPTSGKATTLDLISNLQYSGDASRQSAFCPRFVENPCIKQSNLRSNAQLTIFYAGKVLVFDAFPAEKATEVMELATKLASNSGDDNNNPPSTSENLNTKTAQEAPQPRPLSFGSDMRYPRRASLLKFLQKRKERVIARGPYQMNNNKTIERVPDLTLNPKIILPNTLTLTFR